MKNVKSILPVGMLFFGLMCAVPALSNASEMNDPTMAMEDANAQPAIGGFCPIALHEGSLMKGNSDFAATYQGKKYLFVNAEAKKMFMENPEEYTKDAEIKYQDIMKK